MYLHVSTTSIFPDLSIISSSPNSDVKIDASNSHVLSKLQTATY